MKKANIQIQGFTLIEVLVSLILVGFTIAIFSYMTTPIKLTSKSRSESQAVSIARNYLDTVRNLWQTDCNYLQATVPPLSSTQGFSGYKLTATNPASGDVLFTYQPEPLPKERFQIIAAGSVNDSILARDLRLELFTLTGDTVTVSTQITRKQPGPSTCNLASGV